MNAIDTRLSQPDGAAAGSHHLQLDGVSASYRGSATRSLHAVDLAVAAGEFVALVGPSGAGKTTMLRVIGGLEAPTAGRLAIGGRDVTAVPARARNIGFVFQNYALFGHMTVAENVAFGLRVRPRATRPDRATIARRANELLELVQVGALARRRPAQLSGGQRQRVALARALATDPALLLLDEPFGALDPLVRRDIRTWLRGLHDRLGLTTLLVTHDQAEAIEIADRIAVLDAGRIVQFATPDELEDRPASDFVHRFLGERVAFDGTVTDGALRLDDFPDHPVPFAGSGPVRLSLRPWEVGLGGALAARVTSSRRVGAHWRTVVMLPSGREVELLLGAAPVEPTVQLDLGRARVFGGLCPPSPPQGGSPP